MTIVRALDLDYGLVADVVVPHPGGFESDCFVVDDTWFVKRWKHGRPRRLDLLVTLAERGLPVVPPLPAGDGRLWSTCDGRAFAVFPFVDGRPAGDDDWAAVAAALRQVHAVVDVSVPVTTMSEPDVGTLRQSLDHPWVRDRRHELAAWIDRLDAVIERARVTDVDHVLCHQDFGGDNVLMSDDDVVAILDWDQAASAPREHDLWVAAEAAHGPDLLSAYGARDLDLTHLEYALLARALRDLAARVLAETDRPGVDTWGFRRLHRLERDLALFRPFCR